MSTRRPNVPRAPRTQSDADVLRPDFGAAKTARPAPSSSDAGKTAQPGPSSSGASAATPRTKPRPSTPAARRVQEREGVTYSVRRPVIERTAGSTGMERNPHAADPARAGGAASGDGRPSGTGDASPVPAKSFSGRLLALAVVLISITVLLAPSVRTYIEQRAELGTLSAHIDELEATRSELQNNLARWEDPAYIKQQARNRLFLVMPGETQYLVMGAEQPPEPTAKAETEARTADVPWVESLWQSIERSARE